MMHFICVTCGTQFAATETEPDQCPICLDERQYVGHSGQKWTTLDDYKKTHTNVFAEEEPDLHSILPQPKAGIGQRAFLVRTKEGNVLWDCVPRRRSSADWPRQQSRRCSRSPLPSRSSPKTGDTSTHQSVVAGSSHARHPDRAPCADGCESARGQGRGGRRHHRRVLALLPT